MADAASPEGSFFSADKVFAEKPAYALVAQSEAQAFSTAVSELITKQDYVPQGGVFVAMSAKGPVFCQALVLSSKA
jgi:hypothetical protein